MNVVHIYHSLLVTQVVPEQLLKLIEKDLHSVESLCYQEDRFCFDFLSVLVSNIIVINSWVCVIDFNSDVLDDAVFDVISAVEVYK